MSQKLLLYSDGGARGNPGPAAAAYIATTETGILLKADSRFIGNRTNNQAEYEALLMALKYAVEQQSQEVTCHLDSELVAKQINGLYQVKNVELQKLNRQVKTLLKCFKAVLFVNVRREHPQIIKADALVNKTLDEQGRQQLKSNRRVNSCDGKFVHASIRTSNIQRSIDFYQKFFGLKVTDRHEYKAANSELVFMQDPQGKGCILELTFCRDQKEFIQPAYEKRLFDHLGFEVSDVYSAIAEMKKAGVTIRVEPKKFAETITIAFVEDPEGTIVELIERTM